MFHKAVSLELKEGTALEVLFQDGCVKRYDMSALFWKYEQLKALEDRELFITGILMGPYGIRWNDELDIETETIYQEGITVRVDEMPANMVSGHALGYARALVGISQAELARRSGIDQSDISKIERGVANPSVGTLNRLAQALGKTLHITIE